MLACDGDVSHGKVRIGTGGGVATLAALGKDSVPPDVVRDIVFHLACDRAGMAGNAGCLINDKAETCHYLSSPSHTRISQRTSMKLLLTPYTSYSVELSSDQPPDLC